MQVGMPYPPVPALNTPPPAPPPSPGPTPPPLPLPIPVPFPEPIPLPLPAPLESLVTLDMGSPQFDILGLASFMSGIPITVGVAANLGLSGGFTFGGTICVKLNFGNLPLLAGSNSCAPPPPPPPAFFAPGGSFGRYGEVMSRGVTTIVFACVVPGDINSDQKGIIISTITTTWNANESACTRVNWVFL